MQAKISEVTNASYYMIRTSPPILVISAHGNVPTSGWNNGVLSPWVYITPPADGIQDFSFIADAPDGLVLQVISPISAGWHGEMPEWVKGFRLHASTNSLEIVFGRDAPHQEEAVLRGGEVPWPRSTVTSPA